MQSNNFISISAMDNYMLGYKGVSFIKQSLYHPLCILCKAYKEKLSFVLQRLSNYPCVDILELKYCSTQWSPYQFLFKSVKIYCDIYKNFISFK